MTCLLDGSGQLGAATLVGAFAIILAFAAPGRAEQAPLTASPVEEIYVLRSVREQRTMPPSDYCASARSRLADPAWEDHYTFRSVATRPEDGRVLDAGVEPAGTIHACFGRMADANVLQLYGEFAVHGITGKAFGPCHMTKSDFPEKGIRLFGCIFELYELPAQYVGGQLTTNSVTSPRLFGTQSEPPGYTQVSIATIRLWKKRTSP
jgi:hypothetical protein